MQPCAASCYSLVLQSACYHQHLHSKVLDLRSSLTVRHTNTQTTPQAE